MTIVSDKFYEERERVIQVVNLKAKSISAADHLTSKGNLRGSISPSIKRKIKQLKAQAGNLSLFAFVNLLLNYAYDFGRFFRWSSANKESKTQLQLQALITMDYHRLEKGLALKEPRVGFGQKNIQRLLSNLKTYKKQYGLDTNSQIALNALYEYYLFNRESGVDNTHLYQEITELKEPTSNRDNLMQPGGTLTVTRQSILSSAQLDLKKFFNSRYSIRHFASDEVDLSLIEQATLMAQKTPSVCNRQSSKVYVFSDERKKQQVLSYQNGNRGFGDQASKILIVVSDLESFTSVGERNQCWIDGGMFAMSLVYALHALGLGTCCLNWSVEYSTDKALKRAVGLRDSESVIMMIAVGHLPHKFKVAQSPRKSLEEVLVIK